MIEALDAFAVRAKLTGSNTAMGRFMGQLFGSKREPWVEGAGAPDRTQVTDNVDDEKTLLVEGRQPPPDRQQIHRAPTATTPGVGRGSGPAQAIPSDAPVAPAEWQLDSRAGRQTGSRPGLPYEAPRTPPNGNDFMTPPQQRMGSASMRPDSEPGSRPLVDEKMGWQTGQSPLYGQMPQATTARVPTGYQDVDLRSVVSRRGWIVFSLLMLAGLLAGILITLR
jgi:hypothetical protein